MKMNNKKRKEANRMAIFFLLFFSTMGILLIYRSEINSESLKTIESTLSNTNIEKGFGNYGRSYAILLEFENVESHYGIYAGTKEQAIKMFENINLEIGKNYKLYLDQTVSNDIYSNNLGIRMIENEEKFVYKENMNSHKIMGIILVAMGILSSSLFYVIAKRKFQ